MNATNPLSQLSRTLYQQLRLIAAGHLRHERMGHSLQPTALVHEVFLRLCEQHKLDITDRAAVLAIAARHTRQLLIDHARRRKRLKRGGPAARRVELDSRDLIGEKPSTDVLDLSDALERLAELNARQAWVVSLRFFGGLTSEEVAATLGVSTRTVESDWRFARAWLRRELA